VDGSFQVKIASKTYGSENGELILFFFFFFANKAGEFIEIEKCKVEEWCT
jgi:hypothetical protein